MLAAALLPNTIGSDVHADFNAYHDDSKLDYSMCGAMTRLHALGLPLTDIIERVTINPARILGEDDQIGTLSAGSRADITVLDPVSGDWDLADAEGETLKVNERLVPALVYREGREFIPNRRLLRDIYETDQRAPVLS